MSIYETTCRAQAAQPAIEKLARLMRQGCDECMPSDLCNKHVAEWLQYRALLIANIPLAKAEFCLFHANEIEERTVFRYVFPARIDEGKGTIHGPIKLYEDVLIPYVRSFSKVMLGGHSLFFPGANSLGKTVAAAYLATELLRKNYSVYYARFPDLHKIHTRSESGAPEERAIATKLLREIHDVDFFIADELGKETTNSNSVRYLAETFLKEREEDRLPTLLITNTPFEALRTEPRAGHSGYGLSFWAMLQERYRVYQFAGEGKDTNLRRAQQSDWSFLNHE